MAKADVTRALEALTKLETPDEIRVVMRAAREQWNRANALVATTVAMSLRPGTRVTFKGRGSMTVTGTVDKVNRTTAHVTQDGNTRPNGRPLVWRVQLHALKILTPTQPEVN